MTSPESKSLIELIGECDEMLDLLYSDEPLTISRESQVNIMQQVYIIKNYLISLRKKEDNEG